MCHGQEYSYSGIEFVAHYRDFFCCFLLCLRKVCLFLALILFKYMQYSQNEHQFLIGIVTKIYMKSVYMPEKRQRRYFWYGMVSWYQLFSWVVDVVIFVRKNGQEMTELLNFFPPSCFTISQFLLLIQRTSHFFPPFIVDTVREDDNPYYSF